MQKPIDLVIEDFRSELINLINNNQSIPLSVIMMIVNELQDNVSKQYSQYKTMLRQNYENELNRNNNTTNEITQVDARQCDEV